MSITGRLLRIVKANLGYLRRQSWAHEQTCVGEEPISSRPHSHDETSSGYAGHTREEIVRAYRLLEIPLGSGPEEIRAAHRRLLQRYHPDRFPKNEQDQGDATRLSQELTAARDLLLESIGRHGAEG